MALKEVTVTSINGYNYYKERLAKCFSISPDSLFLFWKGRVALYAILKAIGIKEGDEVILPAFTCVVAVNPIIYLGAKPVYVDVDPMTYNIDVKTLERENVKESKGYPGAEYIRSVSRSGCYI